MKKYKAKKGSKNFRPTTLGQFLPFLCNGFDFELILHANCWHNVKSPNRFQQNKAGGITGPLSDNNSRAALVSWQVTDIPNQFLVTGYTNNADKSFQFGKGLNQLTVNAGDKVVGSCRIERAHPSGLEFAAQIAASGPVAALLQQKFRADYRIRNTTNNNEVILSLPFDATWHGWYRLSGPWHGGQNPAPHDMSLNWKIKRVW